jgi:hypothetical protein
MKVRRLRDKTGTIASVRENEPPAPPNGSSFPWRRRSAKAPCTAVTLFAAMRVLNTTGDLIHAITAYERHKGGQAYAEQRQRQSSRKGPWVLGTSAETSFKQRAYEIELPDLQRHWMGL